MAKHLFVSFEELETEKVQDLTVQANQTGEYEVLHDNLTKLQGAQSEEQEDKEDGAVSDENSDSDEDTIGQPDSEEQAAMEAMCNGPLLLSMEENGFNSEEIKSKLFSALSWVGFTATPFVFKKLLKGVLYGIVGISKGLYHGTVYLTKYIERRTKSFDKLKTSIDTVQKTLSQLDSSKVLDGQVYSKSAIINGLKIGNSVDFAKNINTLSQFVKNVIADLNKHIVNDAALINRMTSMVGSKAVSTPKKLLTVVPSVNGLQGSNREEYPHNPHIVNAYEYSKPLPSDTLFFAYLPSSNCQNIDELSQAYKESKIFLGLDTKGYKDVPNVNYMTIQQLTAFVSELKLLCDICIQQQNLYKRVLQLKSSMKFEFKNYLTRLIDSERKLSVEESLVQYVHLKTHFIDNVYLMGSVDVHDYCAKTISHGLSLVEAHIKKLS